MRRVAACFVDAMRLVASGLRFSCNSPECVPAFVLNGCYVSFLLRECLSFSRPTTDAC